MWELLFVPILNLFPFDHWFRAFHENLPAALCQRRSCETHLSNSILFLNVLKLLQLISKFWCCNICRRWWRISVLFFITPSPKYGPIVWYQRWHFNIAWRLVHTLGNEWKFNHSFHGSARFFIQLRKVSPCRLCLCEVFPLLLWDNVLWWPTELNMWDRFFYKWRTAFVIEQETSDCDRFEAWQEIPQCW